jgi:hypothetical protein
MWLFVFAFLSWYSVALFLLPVGNWYDIHEMQFCISCILAVASSKRIILDGEKCSVFYAL